MEPGSHLYVVRELQDKYRCLECSSNGFCFVQKHPDTGKLIHINLEASIINLWALKIVEKTSVPAGLPTHVEEFEKLVREAFYPNKKKLVSGQQSGADGYQGDVHVHNHTTVNVPSANIPTIPSTPTGKETKSVSLFSPIYGFTAKDYRKRGLTAFIEWCEEKYGDEDGEFKLAYSLLFANNVGLDTLAKVKAADLITGCKIEFGTAWRIIEAYPTWREFLKVLYTVYVTILILQWRY